MTTDITIGRLKIIPFEKVMRERIGDLHTISFKDNFKMIDFFTVEQCPNEDDGCTDEDTMCPGESYRSGSGIAMNEFFRMINAEELIAEMRPITSNDHQVTLLTPHIDAINALKYDGENFYHKRRLQWLKFWSNKAVSLYGDDAAISFS